ncbi:MAG: acetylglutamate kinase [Clostridiales bacterium]|jgi:acetylglutamate kinase|nr:acetylglutamate kinase [Clostridiales bacterium]
MINHIERANILVEALPYIQQCYNKTFVIKYGGSAMSDNGLLRAVMSDLVLLSLVGIKVVLVHGGGPEINDMLKKIGKKTEFINGLRYTDKETMDIVQMVLCGKINKNLVDSINRTGGKAIGLCGLDGGLLKAKRRQDNGVDYGYVGDIVDIDPSPVFNVLSSGCIPVVSTVAQGVDADVSYNVNADTAAARLAAALGAEKLIVLTDRMGLMRDPEDETTLLSVVKVSDIPGLIMDGVISGGMIPKIECVVEAIRRGVKRAHILDGRTKHSILIEVLSDEGLGTMIL